MIYRCSKAERNKASITRYVLAFYLNARYTSKHMWVFSQSNFSVIPSLVGYRGQLAEVVATMTAELENEQAELVKKEEEHNECVKTAATLSETISNYGRDRESRLLALEKEIKSLKKEVASVSKEFKVSDHQPLVYKCYVHMLWNLDSI